jgi:hypothetical protein
MGIKRLSVLSFLMLAGCLCSKGLSTMSMAQDNIWNLTRICLGMTHCQVLSIMHEPYRKHEFIHDGKIYLTWFYVTRPSALEQCRLVKMNVTPVVFEEGILIGWGYDVYDSLLKKKAQADRLNDPAKNSLEKTIKTLETTLLSQNLEEEGCQCPVCKPRKPPLTEEDDRMIEEANDQNFNFW